MLAGKPATTGAGRSPFSRGLSLVLAAALGPAGAAATIGDRVWVDSNGDGIQDVGEAGRAGVTVKLYDCGADGEIGGGDDLLLSQTTTGGTGQYAFSSLPDGSYYVVFTAPAGMIFTLADQGGDDAADSDADANGRTQKITLAGVDNPDVDCGLLEPASVGDLVFVDADGDGIQDAGEAGRAGVKVRLYTAAPALVGEATTGAAGEYSFTGLTAGDYFIELVPPAGFAVSPLDQGTDDERDSDIDPVTLRSAAFTLAPGEDNTSVDAGVYEPADIRGLVFDDADGDGVREVGDSGRAGVTVQLWDPGDDGAIGGAGGDADSQVGADATTDADGEYVFAGVDPGVYYVRFVAPGGLSFVPPNRGSDAAADSDADPATGCTVVFRVCSGGGVTGLDAGLAAFERVGDFVFLDVDGDGVQDVGEVGVKDVLVALYSPGADGAAGGGDDDLVTHTMTDVNGAYELNVVAGDYFLRFVPPSGYAFTVQDAGADDTVDSDAAADGVTAVFTVVADTDDLTRDAGLLEDADRDGTPDLLDGCPDDPDKVEPGACGCGEPETDTDGDGVPDCVDNCPFVVNPAQTDTDGDGIGNACEAADGDGGDGGDDGDGGDGGDDGDDGDGGDGGDGDGDGDGGATPCGLCGPVGLTSYLLSVGGYAALLATRRRGRR